MNNTTAPITDIRSYSLDDGPGIRTTVFFKGCPLSCAWCHNPENIDPRPQIRFLDERCLGCGDCARACPSRAVTGRPGRIDAGKCRTCGTCADQCPTDALNLTGVSYTMDHLLERLTADREFYRASGGGVTLSGGEATLHARFAGQMLRRLKNRGIHTLLQTCGHYDRRLFEQEMLPYLDMIHFDLKLMDPEQHRRFTGQDNALILENLAALLAMGSAGITVRTPLVPGSTDTPENLRAIRTYLKQCGYRGHHVALPYNPGGASKKQSLRQHPRPTAMV